MKKSNKKIQSDDEKMLLANGWKKVVNEGNNKVWRPPEETGNEQLYSIISALTMQRMFRGPAGK